MSTDLEQFYEVFFEESSELLAEMEMCLLGLDINSPDLEDLNAVFRAAHSIKGGAGTFGFSDMTEMTHMLESLLDKLRKGEIEIRSEMIDSFLKAGDVIKGQLAAHRGDGEADLTAAAAVRTELRQFSEEIARASEIGEPHGFDFVANAEVASNEIKESNAAEVATSIITSASMVFQIVFSTDKVSPKIMENLLANLASMGTLEKLVLASEEQQCKLRLTTDSSEEDVWEALAFIVDPASLTIERENSTDADTISSPTVISHTVESDKSGSTSAQLISSDQAYGFFPGAPAAPKDDQDNTEINSGSLQSCEQKGSGSENGEPLKNHTKSPAASSETSSIRVSTEKVDQMINLVGELVITQAMLAQVASEVDPIVHEKLLSGMNQLERNTRDLQEAVMSIRMLPISFVFSRFPRVVRDLAAKLGKQVEMKTVGEGTELDKGLIEKITDPLTHLIRNSLDHGIELPEERVATGKLAKGTITLRAFHQGGSIIIEVSDDGAGLNREKIIKKALERGLPVNDAMTDEDVSMLIFEAGFSTADVVSDVSGRGVGMDVVKRNIHDMGGRIEIDSALGVGTRITIRLPLTLAILDGLSVAVGDQLFIVPLTYITESFQPTVADIKTVNGRGLVVQVRGEYLPVIALYDVFHIQPRTTEIEDGILVILEAEGRKAAMFVDALVGQHQVVIKSLEKNYRRVQGVSGATIMGDGRVALILDATGLVTASQQESGKKA
jgi:two-component system, chemotaxis family, sensor kinase CheA